MPELPDVALYKRYLDATSLHRRIDRVRVADAGVLGDVPAQVLRETLPGRRFQSTRQHGKHLFVQVEGDDDRWLLLHFGMTSFPKYFVQETSAPPHPRIVVHFGDGSALAYSSRRKLGEVDLVGRPEDTIALRGLGPDPLHPRMDQETFRRLARGRSGVVKSLLMNQSVLAGIGNIYSDEMLFDVGLHPATPVEALDPGQVDDLHGSMLITLDLAIDRDADPRRMPRSGLLPYREAGASCPRCGGRIVRERVAGRMAYFCGQHQTDAGSGAAATTDSDGDQRRHTAA
jgi:formamidopyrimidine-DNA glycosylase